MSKPEDLPEAQNLGALESFDPKVLRPTDKDERKLCSFILSLALVYNDLKDCRLAFSALAPYLPTVATISAAAGQGFGLQNHLSRHFYAVLYELIRLLKENSKLQDTAAFRKIISSLSKGDRAVWEELSELANGGPKTSGLLKALVRVRDNTAAHYYGLDGLAEGYDYFFAGGGPAAESAYISRGPTSSTARFYFADAAVQGYQNIAFKPLSPTEISDLSKNVTIALYQIVTRFLESRSGGFYKVR